MVVLPEGVEYGRVQDVPRCDVVGKRLLAGAQDGEGGMIDPQRFRDLMAGVCEVYAEALLGRGDHITPLV